MSLQLVRKAQEQGLNADEVVELAYWYIETGRAKDSPRIDQWCADVLDDMGRGRW